MSEQEVTSGLGELRTRVGNLERGLADNTASTKRIESDTLELLDMFRAAKGGFRVLGVLGNVVKWAAAVGASIAALWFSFKTGIKP